MNLSFILNGEDVGVRAEAGERLLDILRERFRLSGARAGCLGGACGACLVIFNRSLVPACLVPAFRVHGGEVVTIEGFVKTDEYQDIARGFKEAFVETCGFCAGAKALVTENLLERRKLPPRREIIRAFECVRCRCTDADALADGVLRARALRARRLYGRGL